MKAAACCLGATAVISALTAVGAGFLVNDAFLVPLYVLLLALGGLAVMVLANVADYLRRRRKAAGR